MIASEKSETKPRIAWAVIGILCLVKFVLHFSVSERYGYHGDELYFIECGKRLAFGYVDHPPIVPWIARLSGSLFGYGLTSLRLFPIVAGAATIAFASLLAREFGGGRYAQLLAGLCALIAPAYLMMSSMLNIPVFEPIFWIVCSLLVIRIIRRDQQKLWLAVGLVAGIGLLNKHTMLLWGIGLVGGLILAGQQRQLTKPWPWLGGLVALAIFSPNLVWQYQHEWATVEFIRNIDKSMLAEIPRILFLLGQILYMHPFTIPIWVLGIYFFFARNQKDLRAFGWLYVVVLTILLIRHGKPYYLAPIYPMLFAGGAVVIERWISGIRRIWLQSAVVAFLVFGGAVLVPFALPILSITTKERIVGAIAGRIIPPEALTGDMRLQNGWHSYIRKFEIVYANLEIEEQSTTVILSDKYNIVSAVNFFDSSGPLPHAYSGHMTHYFWGPPPATTTTLLACGIEEEKLRAHFESVTEGGSLSHPLGDGEFEGMPIYICRNPHQPLPDMWPEFKCFDHVRASQPPSAEKSS